MEHFSGKIKAYCTKAYCEQPKNFEYYTTRRFGQQNPELSSRSWKLNGNIFFELFLSDLDEKIVTLNIFNCTARRHLDNNRDGMKLAHE